MEIKAGQELSPDGQISQKPGILIWRKVEKIKNKVWIFYFLQVRISRWVRFFYKTIRPELSSTEIPLLSWNQRNDGRERSLTWHFEDLRQTSWYLATRITTTDFVRLNMHMMEKSLIISMSREEENMCLFFLIRIIIVLPIIQRR